MKPSDVCDSTFQLLLGVCYLQQYNPNKYVLGPDGQPLRDKHGHKIRVRKEPKKESTSNGHEHVSVEHLN